MESPSKFLAPGSDGELGPSTDLWRKGLVFTKRARPPSLQSTRQNYRISVLFKRGVGAAQPFTGFHEVYRRVAIIASHRLSQLTCPETGETPGSIILCHGWRWIGESIITALITLDLRCSDQSWTDLPGEPSATEEALRSPGGATLEELTRLVPQSADEIYNEFDFTDASTPNANVVTLSYGEPVSYVHPVDFRPFVERAERLARSYQSLLQIFGEATSRTFRIKRREWFFASQTFATVHVCFDP